MTINDTDQSHLLKDLTFTEKADYEKGFSAYFEEKIKPELEPLEKLRLETLDEIQRRKPKAFLDITVIIIIALLFNKYLVVAGFFYTLLVKGFLYLFTFATIYSKYFEAFQLPKKKYVETAKLSIMPIIISFFKDFSYDVKGRIDKKLLYKSRIIFHPMVNCYFSEDYIKGIYKDVKIQLTELSTVKSKEETNNGERVITISKKRSALDGLFLVFETNKAFTGQTVVRFEAGNLNNKIGHKLWDGISTDEKNVKLEKVRLEDPEFEKKFEVYSTDQVEARYLLTTAFMERILHLVDIYGSKKIQCSFVDNYFFINIYISQDLFEPQGPEKSIINTDDIHTFLEQMHSIFQIVDVLKLNQKIGM